MLISFLQSGLVENYGWLTQNQLLDATAVGQFTPGPVFTTATFIGFLLGGFKGAVVATIGIFLPSFVLVALSGRLIPKLRKSPTFAHFLDGINAAALGLMAAVTVTLGRDALIDIPSCLLGALCLAMLIRYKPNSVWLVLAGAAFGEARWFLG